MCRICDDFKELTGSRKFFKIKQGKGDGDGASMSSTGPGKQNALSDEYSPYPCPPDSAELGNASWTFLHTTAAYYPDAPSDKNKENMRTLINALVDLYPCKRCSSHLAKDVIENPPDLSSAESISKWFCDLHNRVNARLGKPEMDCSRIMERYKTGTPGTECYVDLSEHGE